MTPRSRIVRASVPSASALALACAGLLLGVLALPDGAAAQVERPKAEVEIKIATLAPEGTTAVDSLHAMDVEIREKTGGKVGFKLYPGGVMGEEKDVLGKVRRGQLHGGAFTGMGLGEIVPSIRALEIPFFFKSYEECDAATGAVKDRITKLFDEEGWVELGKAEQGFIYVLSVKQITTVEELKKSRFVMLGSDPLAQMIIDAVDLKPIPQNVTDVLTSLATGAIDTVYISPAYAISLQWSTKTKFLADFPVTNGTGFIAIRKDTFNKIPADLQPVVLEVTRRHSAELIPRTRKEGDDALDLMKKQGIKITELTQEQKKEFEKVGVQVREKMPSVLLPNDPQKQQAMKELIATIVKTVEDMRAGKGPAAAGPAPAAAASAGGAAKPPAKGK